MIHPFFEILTDAMTEELFLKEFSKKYHYEEPQLSTLKAVAVSMQKRICRDCREGLAGWDWRVSETVLSDAQAGNQLAEVCITLGPGIDSLQEEYLQQELLTEAYMVETLSSELLLKAYPRWNQWVKGELGCGVRRFHFPGNTKECSLDRLPTILKTLQVPVNCTRAYCLIPKKSVVFYAELVDDSTEECRGICMDCGNTRCPNRMKTQMTSRQTDMMNRPFTYGYQRIFSMEEFR